MPFSISLYWLLFLLPTSPPVKYVEEFIKMINILKAHVNIQDDFLKLNLFIDTDKGIDIVDKVNSRTRDEEDEE